MARKTTEAHGHGVVSFFSGCGILDLGFERAGFEVRLANELNPAFADAYEHARRRMAAASPGGGAMHEVVRASVADFFGGRHAAMLRAAMDGARDETGAVGFVGGPPCPDFSVAGKQAGRTGDNGRLTQDYFDLIGVFRPDFFLFENVRGLRSTAKHSAFLDEMLAGARADGYALAERTVNALDYGAPQERHRVIVVGFHRDAFTGAAGMADGFGWDAHASHRNAAARGRWPGKRDIARDADGRIVQEVVQPPEDLGADLLDLTVGRWFERNGVDDHPNARDVFAVKAGLGRMRQVAEGDTSRKSFKRLHRWRYSPTVAYGNNEVHLHPWLDRRLSVAEAMALQSLPREFELPAAMTLTDKFKTVGNGVPLKLAEALALAIRDAARGRAAMPVRLDPARGRTPVPEAVPMPGAPDLAEAA